MIHVLVQNNSVVLLKKKQMHPDSLIMKHDINMIQIYMFSTHVPYANTMFSMTYNYQVTHIFGMEKSGTPRLRVVPPNSAVPVSSLVGG